MIGPNDSSLAMNMLSSTLVKMVGSMKKPFLKQHMIIIGIMTCLQSSNVHARLKLILIELGEASKLLLAKLMSL